MRRVIETEPGFEVCGEYGSGKGAVETIQQAQPDIVLLDLSLPDASGLELIRDLRNAEINVPILIISMHDENLYAERVLRTGANGYLMKQEATEKVIEGIRHLLNGEVYISPAMNRRMLRSMTNHPHGHNRKSDGNSLDRLSDREFEVFDLIGQGVPTRKIAAILKISEKTVEAHRAHIKEKLNLADGAELVRFAVHWVDSVVAGQS